MLLLCNPLKVLCQSMLLHQGCITRCTQHGSNKPDKSKASHQSNNATCNIQLTLPRPQSLRKVFAPSFPTADHSTKQILLKTYELNNKSTPNHAIQPKQSCSWFVSDTQQHYSLNTNTRNQMSFTPWFRAFLFSCWQLIFLRYVLPHLALGHGAAAIPALIPHEPLILADPTVTSTLWSFRPIPTSTWRTRYHSIFQFSVM